MFEKIVAAIDDDADRSAKVTARTRELARAFESEVLVAHIREPKRS